MLLSLVACGGKAKAKEVGKYEIVDMKEGGQSLMEEMKKMGMESMLAESFLELKEDGTGTLSLMGEETSFTWKDGQITSSDGLSTKYEFKDGTLTMTENDTVLEFKQKK